MAIQGEVDLADEQSLVESVDALVSRDGAESVELDLGAVEFIDSSGVRALVLLRSRHGERIRVGPLSEPVRRVLEVAGMTEFLGVDGP